MASSTKHRKIEELLSKAEESLARNRAFEAERMALKALLMARQDNFFDVMARIVPCLQQSRVKRFKQALKINSVTVVETAVTEDMKIEPGCYLIQPPQVGADARRLRLAALAGEIPVAVICREPLTKLKQVPVVAISPGSTIRAKVDPPSRQRGHDMTWFVSAMAAIGDGAIQNIDPTMPVSRRVDLLLERLDAVPEHEPLHQTLMATCLEAHEAQLTEKPAANKNPAKIKVNAANDEDADLDVGDQDDPE